jgi:hypothetical protein
MTGGDFWILFMHFSSTLFMTGLIWFVQIVHYPLKAYVGPAGFADYQAAHVERTGWVVGLPMIVEALSGAWILVRFDSAQHIVLMWASMLVLLKVWLVTAAFSVRAHHQLSSGFTRGAHRMLVRTNWMRTAGWSVRTLLVLWFVKTTVS